MKTALRVEFEKFINQRSLWVIFAFLLISSSISIYTNVYNDPEALIRSLCADSMIFLIAGGIYAGLSISSDFTNGFIRHYLVSGHKKTHILLAKYIHYVAGSAVILIIYPYISLLLSILYHGPSNSGTLFYEMTKTILLSLPLYFSYFTLFFMIAILSKNDGIVMGIAIPFSIVSVVFTQRLLLDYTFLKYTPIIQIQEVVLQIMQKQDYLITLLVCVCIISTSLFISMKKLEKDQF